MTQDWLARPRLYCLAFCDADFAQRPWTGHCPPWRQPIPACRSAARRSTASGAFKSARKLLLIGCTALWSCRPPAGGHKRVGRRWQPPKTREHCPDMQLAVSATRTQQHSHLCHPRHEGMGRLRDLRVDRRPLNRQLPMLLFQ